MTPFTKDEMRDALATSQRPLLAIALAILRQYPQAEDVVSACTVSALEQITNGKVRAQNADAFHGWLRSIVRRNARRRAGQHIGDLMPAAGERNVRRIFTDHGGLRRHMVGNVCAPTTRTVAVSARKPRLNEFDD